MKLYIVRDSHPNGRLFQFVSVWNKKPKRRKCGQGYHWSSQDGDSTGFVGSYFLIDAHARYGTVPDDDLQMIVVGLKC